METIKFKKKNQLNEKDLAEINKIMNSLNITFQGDIKFWHIKEKYFVNCNDNHFFKITKNNKLKLEKNAKKLLLCYYDTPILDKEFGNVVCDVNKNSVIFSLNDDRNIFGKWCLIIMEINLKK